MVTVELRLYYRDPYEAEQLPSNGFYENNGYRYYDFLAKVVNLPWVPRENDFVRVQGLARSEKVRIILFNEDKIIVYLQETNKDCLKSIFDPNHDWEHKSHRKSEELPYKEYAELANGPS